MPQQQKASSSNHNKDRMLRNKHGGLFILCDDDQYAGMYPASLSEILECSMSKAEFVIKLLEDLIITLDLHTLPDITNTVFRLSHIVSDPPEREDVQYYRNQLKKSQTHPESLISIDDIADILGVTDEFAIKLYKLFNKPIIDEETLEKFLLFIDKYLVKNHNDTIPEEFKRKTPPRPTLSNNSPFDSKRIQEILKQEAPPELKIDSLIQPEIIKPEPEPEPEISQTRLDKIDVAAEEFEEVPLVNTQDNTLNKIETNVNELPDIDDIEQVEYNSETVHLSPHFATTCETLQDILDIDLEDAAILLSSKEALSDFLEVEDTQIGEKILDDIAKGDMQSLLEAIDEKVEGMLSNIANTTLQKMFEGNTDLSLGHKKEEKQEKANEVSNSSSSQTQSATSSVSQAQPEAMRSSENMNNGSQNISASQTEVQKPAMPELKPMERPDFKALSEQQLAENKPPTEEASNVSPPPQQPLSSDTLPNNLSDMLRMAFGVNNRVTAKTLAKSFEMFDIEISQSLARFIIEEGGYGGEAPNSHRIMDTEQLEVLIKDIEETGSLKDFVKHYLEKINNDLKSMLTGGGGD